MHALTGIPHHMQRLRSCRCLALLPNEMAASRPPGASGTCGTTFKARCAGPAAQVMQVGAHRSPGPMIMIGVGQSHNPETIK